MRTPRFSPRQVIAVLAVIFLTCNTVVFAQQRGQIIKPASLSVMDPNQDGYVSATTAGFSGDGFSGYHADEFEFPMFGIPIVGDGEALADNQAGPACGISDLTVDSLGFGAYAVLRSNGYMAFRFRIGDHNPSVESYSILMDIDGLMGTDDPNSTPDNPGFEIDVTLIKNQNQGVYIYNIDGIESCPTPLANYSFNSHFQIAIADIITCTDLDYFYDYFIPFADLQSFFGVTGNTEIRMVAVTNMSGTCAMSGRISDIGGVDDDNYAGCPTCAFLDLGTSQCPTIIDNLCGTCGGGGFLSGVTPKPTIDTPVKAGETVLTGTAVGNAAIFVDLFDAGSVLQQSVTTTTSAGCTTNCAWSVTFASPMEPGDIVSARARAASGCSSAGVSSDATVEIVIVNVPPQLQGASTPITYTENASPLAIDAGMLIVDPDNLVIDGATVTISTGFIASEDVLSFTPAAGISGSFNPTTGTINLLGTAALTEYQSLLRSVSYSNTSESPNIQPRFVTFQVFDGLDLSNVITRQINVVSVNDAPVAINDNGATQEEVPVTLPNISSNDTDVDGTVEVATIDLDPVLAGQQTSSALTQGLWSVNPSGDVTFTPAANFNGTASRTYLVQDNAGSPSNIATISIVVSPVNDPPVAVNDAGTTNEDIQVTLNNITANDTDPDGTIAVATVDLDPVTAGVQSAFTNSQGSWTVDGAGNLNYTPTANFNGSASLSYLVEDNLGAVSNVATVTINVTPVNDAPVAVNDNGTTDENTPINLPNIGANDTDVDGTVDVTSIDLDPLTAGQQTAVLVPQGQWTVDAAGQVTFSPVAQFNGTVVRAYTIRDDDGALSNSASITVVVNAINDPPVANNDTGVTNEDIAVTITNITANDTDGDGTVDPASVDLDPSTPGKQSNFSNADGTWSVNASADLTFTPTLGFTGNASSTYTVNDNSGATSNVATILIVVNEVVGGNIPPVAVNDSGTTDEEAVVTLLNITSNDTDADGTIDPATVDFDPITAGLQNSASTAQGTWSVNSGGDVTFTPVTDYHGIASHIYTVRDNAGATSNSATITVTVNSINDLPVANDDDGATNEGTPVVLAQITSNDTDVDGIIDPTTVDLDPGTAGQQTNLVTTNGVWTVDAAGNVNFTPSLNFSGSAIAIYTVNDDLGGMSNAATITVLVAATNDPPVANNDSGSTQEDLALTLGDITANDTDVDGTVDKSTIDLDPTLPGQQTIVTVAQGTWEVNAVASLTFTPVLNFTGSVSVQYTVSDNDGATSNSATVTIVVSPVNDPPVAVDDQGFVHEDNVITIPNITANDTDEDGTIDPASVDLDPAVAGKQNLVHTPQGTWGVDADGNLFFDPTTNFNGIVAISYTVQDNQSGVSQPATVTITVHAVNDFPVVGNITVQTHRNQAVQGSLNSPDDVDPDGTVLSVNTTPANTPDHGTIVINSDGTYTYTPDLDYVGPDLVEIEYCDQGIPAPPACAVKELQITVEPANSAPVILVNNQPGATLNATTPEDTPVVVCFNAVDPDGDPVTINSITNISGGGTLVPFGNIKYCFEFTPVNNFTGVSRWTLQACDNGSPSLCGTLEVTILVLPLNDAPITVADTLRTLRNVQVTANLLDNVYDVEGQSLAMTTTPVTPPSHGNMTLNSNGEFIYKSDIQFRGIDSFVYEVCDDGSPTGCTQGSVVIVVEDLPLKVYEGISPNGDGNNDYLRIDGIDFYIDNRVQIFDRYNNLVFEVSGYNNEDKIWTGQANRGIGTTELPEETYFYAIHLGDGSDPFTGFVVLKRR